MFRTTYKYPENDILFLDGSKESVEKCGIELDSVGRPKGAQPVDQFDSQPFMMAENGFKRSDISILMSAQSDDLKRAVAQRMQEVQASYPDQSLSDSELADMAKPRYCQSWSDLRDWASSLEKSGIAKEVDAFIEANKPKEPASPIIDFSDTNPSE